jgi:hypothetical protein
MPIGWPKKACRYLAGLALRRAINRQASFAALEFQTMAGGKFTRRVREMQHVKQGSGGEEAPPESAPLGGTRAEAQQRLQVGLAGLATMVLMIGLASVLGNQADINEEMAVPDAAPTTEPTETAPQRDPLADAGIVPELPADPSPTPGEGQVDDLPNPVVEDAQAPSNAPQN